MGDTLYNRGRNSHCGGADQWQVAAQPAFAVVLRDLLILGIHVDLLCVLCRDGLWFRDACLRLAECLAFVLPYERIGETTGMIGGIEALSPDQIVAIGAALSAVIGVVWVRGRTPPPQDGTPRTSRPDTPAESRQADAMERIAEGVESLVGLAARVEDHLQAVRDRLPRA